MPEPECLEQGDQVTRLISTALRFWFSLVGFSPFLFCLGLIWRSYTIKWFQTAESGSFQDSANYLSLYCPKKYEGHSNWAVDLVIQNWLTFLPEIVAAVQHVWGTSIYLELNLISTFWEMGSKLLCQSQWIRTQNSFISWRFWWSLQFCIKRTHYS